MEVIVAKAKAKRATKSKAPAFDEVLRNIVSKKKRAKFVKEVIYALQHMPRARRATTKP
jgi:hypothetical protein